MTKKELTLKLKDIEALEKGDKVILFRETEKFGVCKIAILRRTGENLQTYTYINNRLSFVDGEEISMYDIERMAKLY